MRLTKALRQSIAKARSFYPSIVIVVKGPAGAFVVESNGQTRQLIGQSLDVFIQAMVKCGRKVAVLEQTRKGKT